MDPSSAAAGAAGAPELPMEPLGSRVPQPEQPQVPGQAPGPESPQSSPKPGGAGKEAAGADPAGGKRLPSPRPALLRVPPPSLGYGAFRRQVSACPEALPPPSPGPAAAEPGTELAPWAAAGEPGSWAPMELQVDVRVTPVGAAGGSRAPSPAPSTRFLTVPVPESPACPRRASPGFQPRPRTLSSGSTWGRGAPPWGVRAAEPGPDAEGSPGGRCRCKEKGLEKEDSALLSPGGDDDKLPRAVKLIGLSTYLRSLQCALVVLALLLAVSAVAIVALASRAGTQCHPCPQDWLWAEEHCYYLSGEEGSWEAGQSFCATHQATLPQQGHIQDLLGRYLLTKDSWLGARQGLQGWHWMDGTPLQPQLPRFPEEDLDKSNASCVGLQGDQLVAWDCSSSRHWVCIKETL